jgi:hypothetical protein
MPIARLILCEKSNRWAVALRRALGERQHVLRQTRSLAECSRSLAVSPASLVVVECRADNLDSLLSAAGKWLRHFPHVQLAAVMDGSLAPAEALLREAGAVAVIRSPRHVRSLARLALRHVDRAPAADLSLVEAIVERLPWARWASRSA